MRKRIVCPLLWSLMLLSGLGIMGCRGTVWSSKDDVRIGREVAVEVEKEFRLDPNPINQQRVQQIGQKLVVVGKQKPFEYSFKVLDKEEVNAFALPGGPIYVFRGLLDMLGDDDDALACVLGHEMTHINRRHAAKQYTKGVWASVLVTVVDPKGRIRDAAELGAILVQLQYSRDDEYESDRFGIEYAYKAGYDPNGVVSFFQKLKAKEKGGDKGVLANLRSHPLTENRIWRAQQQISKLTGSPMPEPPKGGKK
jgi:predicted Zn-dependent protease